MAFSSYRSSHYDNHSLVTGLHAAADSSADEGGFVKKSAKTTTSSTIMVSNNGSAMPASNTNYNATITSCSTSSAKEVSTNWSKLQALKQRKLELEKLLSEKNALLQRIQQQEVQVSSGQLLSEFGGSGEFENVKSASPNVANLSSLSSSASLRRKLGASFKLSKGLESDVERLLAEKKYHQEVINNSYRLANDPSLSKSIRRSHKADYENSQQKLISINHNLNLMKKRPIKSNTLHTSSPSSSSSSPKHYIQHHPSLVSPPQLMNVTPTTKSSPQLVSSISSNNLSSYSKSPSFSPTNLKGAAGSGYHSHGLHQRSKTESQRSSNNSVNNCYNSSDRRNSIKSLTNSASKSAGYSGCSSGGTQSQSSFQQRSSDDFVVSYNQKTNMNLQQTEAMKIYEQDLTELFSNIQQQQGYLNAATGTINNDRYLQSSSAASSQYSPQKHRYSASVNLADKNEHMLRKIMENANHPPMSLSAGDPDFVQPGNERFSNYKNSGLGGYWKNLPNNERIWCTVDNNSFDKSDLQQQQQSFSLQNRLKKSNNVAVTQLTRSAKSSVQSLNDVLIGGSYEYCEPLTAPYSAMSQSRDDFGDKVSLSSISSDPNKKSAIREKQWLETSLDGPVIKTTKQSPHSPANQNNTETEFRPKSSTAITSKTLPIYSNSVPLMQSTTSHIMYPPQSSAADNNRPSYPYHHHHHHPPKYSHSYREVSASAATGVVGLSEPSKRPTALHPAANISNNNNNNTNSTNDTNNNHGSTSSGSPFRTRLSSQSMSNSHNAYRQQYNQTNQENQIFNTLLTPQKNSNLNQSPQSTAVATTHNNNALSSPLRSPNVEQLSKAAPDIRIESPKNVTVVQQAIFMPYKEVTKPFEMSDFYKYSTKFRQKDTTSTKAT